jgi:hypothetical protein
MSILRPSHYNTSLTAALMLTTSACSLTHAPAAKAAVVRVAVLHKG